MHRFLLSVCIFMVMDVLVARAGEEATYIEQSVTLESVPGQMSSSGTQKIWFTDHQLRNETTYGDLTSVAMFDLRQRRVVLIPGVARQYIELGLSEYQDIVAMRLSISGLTDPDAEPELTRTEEQKKIGEWDCVKYLYEQGGEIPVRAVLWVSSDTGVDFATYVRLMETLGLQKMLGGLAGMVKLLEGYPVMVETEQVVQEQKIISRHEVKRISRVPAESKLFVVPDGYERIKDESLQPGKADKGGKK